jgi:hypothetical protein
VVWRLTGEGEEAKTYDLGWIHGTWARNVTLDFVFQKEDKKILGLGLCGMWWPGA